MDHICPQGYTFLNQIGSGAFSTVYKGEFSKTHEMVAIKLIPKKSNMKEDDIERIKREIRIYKNVIHPSIARFIDSQEDDFNYYIIMEYCSHGSLAEFLKQKVQLPESQARHIFCQVAQGVRYLHEVAHVIHRDIKVENIMFDRDDNARIIDFGLSTEFDPEHPLAARLCGSPKYVAPEVYLRKPYDARVDIWALGVNLYYCVCGTFPFYDPNLRNLAHKVKHDEPNYPSYLSPNLADLLHGLLQKDPAKRLTWKQIFEHPWLFEAKINLLYRSRSQIRTMIEMKFEASKRAENDENDNGFPNSILIQNPTQSPKKQSTPTKNAKKRTRSNAHDGLKHLLAPEKGSVIDKLCATGRFRRKKPGETNSSNTLSNLQQSNGSSSILQSFLNSQKSKEASTNS